MPRRNSALEHGGPPNALKECMPFDRIHKMLYWVVSRSSVFLEVESQFELRALALSAARAAGVPGSRGHFRSNQYFNEG